VTVIGGDAATRIYDEVVRGTIRSSADSEEERKFRDQVAESDRKIKEEGGAPDPVKEFP
jgi:hypothetical protein